MSFGLRIMGLLLALALIPVLPGCSTGPADAPDEGEVTSTKETPVETVANAEAPASTGPSRSKIPKLEGRWKLVMSQGGYDLDICLVDIAPKTFEIKLVAVSDMLTDLELGDSTAKDGDVHFSLNAGELTLDFAGVWSYGDVVGNLAAPEVMIVPAKMIRSMEKSLPRPEEPPHSLGYEEFNKALQSDDVVAQLSVFLESTSHSPLALEGYNIIGAFAKKEGFSKERTQELATKFQAAASQWGPRLAPKANFDLGATLARQNYLPEIAKKLLDKAREAVTEDTPDEWRVTLASGLISVGDFASTLELMRPMREKFPFDPMVSFNLARALEAKGDDAGALELYAALTVIPAQEDTVRQMIPEQQELLPSERASELWTKIEGSTDGFEAYLNKIYRRELTSFAAPKQEHEPAEGHRTSLVEIFTGSACPPCVAADAAAAGLEVTYPEEDLIVLRYHQHIPLYDPLANEESKDRFVFYIPNQEQQGTPATFLNGMKLDGFAGGIERAEGIYGSAKELVAKDLTETTDISIALTATAQDGEVTVSAEAKSDKEFSPTARLRLAIVEDAIEFKGMNGIRVHDGIVRVMPGGVRGISAEEGKLSFTGTVALPELKQELIEQNKQVEAFFKRQLAGRFSGEFPVQKPTFRSLRLVGFVQNERTHEVLQAVSIPVTGETIVLDDVEATPVEKSETEGPELPSPAP